MELTDLQTAILVCVYLFGVFSCKFATQFFEVSHAARVVERTIYRCLLLCAKIHEDAAFLQEIKYKHLKEAGFDKKQIRDFMDVDKQIMNSWKESIVQTILTHSPKVFSFVLKFTNWKEAMHQLNEMREEE
jgi:uncharacterized protein (UPF0335 family)